MSRREQHRARELLHLRRSVVWLQEKHIGLVYFLQDVQGLSNDSEVFWSGAGDAAWHAAVRARRAARDAAEAVLMCQAILTALPGSGESGGEVGHSCRQ